MKMVLLIGGRRIRGVSTALGEGEVELVADDSQQLVRCLAKVAVGHQNQITKVRISFSEQFRV